MIEIKNIHITYNRKVITNSNIKLEHRGITVIKGESGSGKTSVIRNILFQEQQFDEYIYNGKQIHTKEQIDYLFSLMDQNNTFIEDLTVKEHFQLLQKIYPRKNIDNYIQQLEVSHTFHKYPKELSGGEQNRIYFLFCLLKDTPVIILDEPTAALDSYFINEMKNIIIHEAKNHLFIISSHNPILFDIADTMYEIKNQQLICVKSNNIDGVNDYKPNKQICNFIRFFIKMKKHKFISNFSLLFLFSISIVITSLAVGYSFSANNSHYNQVKDLVNDEIIVYKPLMQNHQYYFSGNGNEPVITDEEMKLLENIKGVKQIVPHIELELQDFHASFEQMDNGEVYEPSIKVVSKENEKTYTENDFYRNISLVNFDEINEDEIEYRLNDEGVYISQELAQILQIKNNKDYELSLLLPIPQYNIVGDGEFSYMEEKELYPITWVQCQYVPIKIKVAGVLKGNSFCLWSYNSTDVIFLSQSVFEQYISTYMPAKASTYYFDKDIMRYTQNKDETHNITNVCYKYPWTPNSYKIKIDRPQDYSRVLSEIRKIGFSTMSANNDIEDIDKIAYHTSYSFIIFSTVITGVIIFVYAIIKYIDLYKNKSFIVFFSNFNYSKLKIRLLLMEKYLIDTVINLLFSFILLTIFQMICIKINFVIAPITSLAIYMIFGLSIIIEFIFPIILGGIYYDRT